MRLFYRCFWYLLWLLPRIYFRLRVYGKENIPAQGAVLIAANHSSYLDPPMIALGINREIQYLAKQELFSIPLIGWWIRKIGTHPVRRKEGDTKAIFSVMRLLKKNHAVGMFPEGTRTDDGKMQPFEDGIAWIAIRTQTPIVPLYLHGTFDALPRGAKLPRPKKVTMIVGEPIYPDQVSGGKNQEEKVKKLTQSLFSTISHLKDRLECMTQEKSSQKCFERKHF